jgi:hypothetical protein
MSEAAGNGNVGPARSVLVADDEPDSGSWNVRSWSAGIEVAAEAHDGLEALASLQVLDPHRFLRSRCWTT